MAVERWETREEVLGALARFESTLDGYVRPAAFGVGRAKAESTVFPYVCAGDHLLPAAVLATVTGYRSGNWSYDLSLSDLREAIGLLAPAEACVDFDHPNLAAWRVVAANTVPDETIVAVLVQDLEAEATSTHEVALRDHLTQALNAFGRAGAARQGDFGSRRQERG